MEGCNCPTDDASPEPMLHRTRPGEALELAKNLMDTAVEFHSINRELEKTTMKMSKLETTCVGKPPK
jgi:hypothetical protein